MENMIEHEILNYISQNDGEVGFYHITRRFGLPTATYDLPAVVEGMVKEGLIEVTNIISGSNERYRVTQAGRQTLL